MAKYSIYHTVAQLQEAFDAVSSVIVSRLLNGQLVAVASANECVLELTIPGAMTSEETQRLFKKGFYAEELEI